MEKSIHIQGLKKEYRDFKLREVSFSLPGGYIMGLIGPNGAGKTTIIKLIMNLIHRDAGQIQILGKDNVKSETEVKARIGYVSDEPHYYEDVSLRDTAKAHSLFYSTWDEDLFSSLMERFDLPIKKTFKSLSQGMRIKFALALAFSHHPDLLIMDEPTTGLDPVFRRGLLDMLSEFIQDDRRSVLFSTHITSDLEGIADYVTFIHNGRIVFSQTLDELRENWRVVKGGEELLTPERLPLLTSFKKGDFGIEALTGNVKLWQKNMPSTCVVESASLEDIMYFIKKGAGNGR